MTATTREKTMPPSTGPTTALALLEQSQKTMHDDVAEMKIDIAAIRLAITSRPSWTVTTYITIMTALSTGLLGYITAHH